MTLAPLFLQDIILSLGKKFIVMYLFHVLFHEFKHGCVIIFYTNSHMCYSILKLMEHLTQLFMI
jgi:hypothetical protein